MNTLAPTIDLNMEALDVLEAPEGALAAIGAFVVGVGLGVLIAT